MSDHSHVGDFVIALMVLSVFVIAASREPCPPGSALTDVFAWPPVRCVVLVR